MSYAFKDAEMIRKQIEALKALYPEMQEDADLLAGMVEGETDFERVVEKLVSFVREADTMAEAVKSRKDDISERQKRYERQGEAGRRIILQLMQSAEKTKLALPEATVSVTAPREKADVTDPEALPQGFFKIERKPLSKEILTALKAGESVPGAELRVGEPGLMVRAK